MADGIEQVGGSSTVAASSRGFGELSTDEYFKIILEEMSNQDPTDPSDTSAMLEQLSTLYGIESDRALQSSLNRMVDDNEFATAAGLIGTEVSGLRDAGETGQGGLVSGLVTSVTRGLSGTFATLESGERVALSDLRSVRRPEGSGVADGGA